MGLFSSLKDICNWLTIGSMAENDIVTSDDIDQALATDDIEAEIIDQWETKDVN